MDTFLKQWQLYRMVAVQDGVVHEQLSVVDGAVSSICLREGTLLRRKQVSCEEYDSEACK
jgi:hypothetical protein